MSFKDIQMTISNWKLRDNTFNHYVNINATIRSDISMAFFSHVITVRVKKQRAIVKNTMIKVPTIVINLIVTVSEKTIYNKVRCF